MTLNTVQPTSVEKQPTIIALEAARSWIGGTAAGARDTSTPAPSAETVWFRTSAPASAGSMAGGGSSIGLPAFGRVDADEWHDVARLMQDTTFQFLADEPDLYGEGDYEPV